MNIQRTAAPVGGFPGPPLPTHARTYRLLPTAQSHPTHSSPLAPVRNLPRPSPAALPTHTRTSNTACCYVAVRTRGGAVPCSSCGDKDATRSPARPPSHVPPCPFPVSQPSRPQHLLQRHSPPPPSASLPALNHQRQRHTKTSNIKRSRPRPPLSPPRPVLPRRRKRRRSGHETGRQDGL